MPDLSFCNNVDRTGHDLASMLVVDPAEASRRPCGCGRNGPWPCTTLPMAT